MNLCVNIISYNLKIALIQLYIKSLSYSVTRVYVIFIYFCKKINKNLPFHQTSMTTAGAFGPQIFWLLNLQTIPKDILSIFLANLLMVFFNIFLFFAQSSLIPDLFQSSPPTFHPVPPNLQVQSLNSPDYFSDSRLLFKYS